MLLESCYNTVCHVNHFLVLVEGSSPFDPSTYE